MYQKEAQYLYGYAAEGFPDASAAALRSGVITFLYFYDTKKMYRWDSVGAAWIDVASAAQISFDPGSSLPAGVTDVQTAMNLMANATIQVTFSRNLANSDDGKTLECTVDSITLTVPSGLETNFGCAVIPSGTTSIASSGGTLLNGATSTLTRAAASNSVVAIVKRASATDSYIVTGS